MSQGQTRLGLPLFVARMVFKALETLLQRLRKSLHRFGLQ
jgi:hypothetical protein